IFDPDFDFQNARYSGSSVYVSAPHDETIEVKLDPKRDTNAGIDNESIALVRQLAEIFEPSSEELPALLSSMLARLVRLFHGERGFIMLWDPVLKELQPMVTVSPEEKQIDVSRKVISATFHEKTALLSSGVEKDVLPYAESDAAPVPRSSISAPLLVRDDAIGLIYIDCSGAGHYDLKSLSLLQAVARLVAQSIIQSRLLEKALMKVGDGLVSDIVGEAQVIYALRADIMRVAAYDTSVLILGETGTGKELIARALHEQSHRREYPFIALNCTAVPESLFESELFGYERGAFTGAASLHRGMIEMAHGGTLFLDEIGDVSLAIQPKLLRFLQEKNFYRIGGTRPIRVDVRIIAATNSDLLARVREGLFREDLYYRLSVMTFTAPPLRERKSDIRILAEHHLKIYAVRLKKQFFGFSDDAMILLEKHPWPGNVRELMNVIERAVILGKGGIVKPEDLILEPSPIPLKEKKGDVPGRTLADVEKEHILRILKHCKGNQMQAARILGIHRKALIFSGIIIRKGCSIYHP
ncbi:MAG: sigma-54-dependent Fis family transcriptional regulator, partial [Candidatus Sumerlaeota bacterium]|nr:sigma-54-dependent Fis family transcriptional regulator [Candidatus Sumerlaeota bacterium]